VRLKVNILIIRHALTHVDMRKIVTDLYSIAGWRAGTCTPASYAIID